jgi:hypothetical protein
MMGLSSGESMQEQKFKINKERLQAMIAQIVSQYVTLMQSNPMLAIECMFRFDVSASVNNVLNNYFIGGSEGLGHKAVNGDLLKVPQYNFE